MRMNTLTEHLITCLLAIAGAVAVFSYWLLPLLLTTVETSFKGLLR